MTLHIYGPDFWHQPVWIVGTTEDLLALRAMLNEACLRLFDSSTLEAPTVTRPFVAADGKGFTLHVHVETETGMADYALPSRDTDLTAGSQRLEPHPDWPRGRPRPASP